MVNEVGTGYDRATGSFVTPTLEMQQLPSEYHHMINRLGPSAAATAKRGSEAEP